MKTDTHFIEKCFHEKNTTIALFLVVCLLFGVVFYSQSYQETRNYQRKSTYGFHNGCAYDVSAQSIESIINHQSVSSYGTMSVRGQIIDTSGFGIGYIGTVDDYFHELEQLTFLEGTYPDSDDKIALEYYILDQLHIPYQLGSSITLDILLSDGSTVSRTYQLCGIIKSYSTNWKSEGFALCNAIVSESSYHEIQRHLFFYGEYDNYEQMEELLPLVTGTDYSSLVYNDYSYPAKEYSVSELVADGMVIIIATVICTLFLVFLQISSYHKLRHRMRVFLTLGADRKELFHALYKQLIRKWGKVYALAAIICTIISISIKFSFSENYKFKLTIFQYALSGILSLLIVLVGKSVQISLLNNVSLLPKGRDLTKYETTIQRNGRHHTIQTEKDFIKIQLRRNRKQFGIELGLAILSFSVLFFCVYGLCESYKTYKTKIDILGFDYSWESNSISTGLSSTDILKIENTANIESVVYTSQISSAHDEPIYIIYQSQGADDYLHCVNAKYGAENDDTGLRANLIVLPENSLLWDYYFPSSADKDSFLAGKGVILFLPELVETSDGFYTSVNTFDTNTYSNLDEIHSCDIDVNDEITLKIGEQKRSVFCIEKLTRFPSSNQTSLDFLVPSSIIISESLYRELFNMESILYNYVFAYGNDHLSYDVGDKLMSTITSSRSIRFTNNRISKSTAQDLLLTDLMSLGSIAAIVSILTLIILYRNRLYLFNVEQERIIFLRNIGCNYTTIRKMYSSKVECFIIPYALVLNVSVILFFAYKDYHLFVSAENIISTWSGISVLAFYNFNWFLLIVPQLIIISAIIFLIKHIPSFLSR